MSKHTPGPWRASELGVLSDKLTSYGNWYVCSLIDPDNEEHKANARLIAAAPELLDVAREAAEWLDLLKQNYPDMAGLVRACRQARDLIARIEGTP